MLRRRCPCNGLPCVYKPWASLAGSGSVWPSPVRVRVGLGLGRQGAAAMPRRAPQVDVDVMVKERPMRTADLECEWQVAPGDKGRPALVSLVPGGSLTFEHRNIAKQARQARAPPSLTPYSRAGRPRRAPPRSDRAGVAGA